MFLGRKYNILSVEKDIISGLGPLGDGGPLSTKIK